MSEKRVRVVVRGWVQGVGFRASCARQASALGLTGWVRNRWDGSVEALFEGPAETVDAMVGWCHHGPSAAEVTGVEVHEAPPGPNERSFRVRL
jgi:acylphosphatase